MISYHAAAKKVQIFLKLLKKNSYEKTDIIPISFQQLKIILASYYCCYYIIVSKFFIEDYYRRNLLIDKNN